MLACAECGSANPDKARFCSTCGARLPEMTAAAPARKQVTILFADISGFTSLSERVDPEFMRGLMSHYFGAMRTIVDRHGGIVEKFIGDAVMAVFGIPTLREDDAIRAVRAAVEMRDSLTGLNTELVRDWGETLNVHIGINTGVVATGVDTLVIGDAVNVAARLQQRAARQEIVLGAETYGLVRGAVEVEELEPLELKGKATAVPAYRLISIESEAFRRRARFRTPLIGRRPEYEVLVDRFEAVSRSRECELVLVMGPAGVGKSRLVDEFVDSVPAASFRGSCEPYGEGITYLPLAQVLRQAADIDNGDLPEAQRAKLVALAEDAGPLESIVPHLGQLLGLVTTTVSSEDVFWAVRKLFESLAREGPLVLVFEDVHWAEPLLLDLLDHIRTWTRDASVLVICTSRPDVLERYPAWATDAPRLSRIDLSPLSEGDSRALVDTILGSPDASSVLPERVVATAEGNPLYLAEIVGMLMDDGLLVEQDGGWALRHPQELRIPATIHAIVGSRLARLPEESRQVIEAGAVMGTTFRRPPLGHLVDHLEEERLGRALDAALEEQLLVPTQSEAEDDALRFYHVVARDVAYAQAAKEQRGALHQRFAEWLESSVSDTLAQHDEVIGYHLEQASTYVREVRPGDRRAGELGRRAGARLAAAGRAALDRSDLVAGVNLLSRARELLPADHKHMSWLLPTLSDALFLSGQAEQAIGVLADGLARAAATGDRVMGAHLALVQAMVRLFTEPEGGTQAASHEVEGAIPVFEAAGDELGLARSWRLLGLVNLILNHFERAEEAFANAYDHAVLAGDRREQLESLFWQPVMVWAGPAPSAHGLQRCRQIEELAGGNLRVLAASLLMRGVLEAMQGSVDEARRCAREARAIFEDLGLHVMIAGPHAQMHGWIELLAGDPAAAERVLREGYEVLSEMNEPTWRSTVAGLLGRALSAQGRHDEAERYAQVCQEVAASDDMTSQALARMVHAACEAAKGDADTALEQAQEAVDLSGRTDFALLHADAVFVLAEVAAATGRWERAEVALGEALEMYRRKGSTVQVQDALELRERLPPGPTTGPTE